MSFEHASRMLKALIESGADGANAHHQHTGLTTGFGSEAYRTQALLDAHENATTASDREHVTTWIKRSPDHRVLYPRPIPALASDLRLTLDYPEDYRVLSAIYDALPSDELIPSVEALNYLRAHPEIAARNAHCVHNVVF